MMCLQMVKLLRSVIAGPRADRGGAEVAQGDDPLTFLARLVVGGGDPVVRGRASGKASR